MNKAIVWIGILGCLSLNACTALTSTKDRSSSAQLHDSRMRMRDGNLVNVSPTNYGTRAQAEATYPIWSKDANKNTTVKNKTIANPTAGNHVEQEMPDAPWRTQPAATSGNMQP